MPFGFLETRDSPRLVTSFQLGHTHSKASLGYQPVTVPPGHFFQLGVALFPFFHGQEPLTRSRRTLGSVVGRVAATLMVLQCLLQCALQCVAVCSSVCCSVLQCFTVLYSVLQCVAVCCSTLQYVAVCCRVLQCVPE